MTDWPGSRHFVMLDGWQHFREPGHWQGWLAQQIVDRGGTVDYPTLPDPQRPCRSAWRSAVVHAVGRQECVVVAHGLSCLLWLGLAEHPPRAELAERVLLVAPPAPGPQGGDVGALSAQVSAEGVRALSTQAPLLVWSADDPYAPGGADALLGQPLGLESVCVPGGAHLNQASGFGPWPDVLEWALTGRWPDAASTNDRGPSARLTAERPATMHVDASADAVAALLERCPARAGRRLGFIAVHLPDTLLRPAQDALRGAGLKPERRLAQLHPRHGEQQVRAGDLARFLEQYGHEYRVALVADALAWPAEQRQLVADAASTSGCALAWLVDEHDTENMLANR